MEINFGGNLFYTNKKEAIKEANTNATATVYKSTAPVVDGEIDMDVCGEVEEKTLYLVMSLGEGASEESLNLVQSFMNDEVVYDREDWHPL